MEKIKKIGKLLHVFRWLSLSYNKNRVLVCPKCGSQNIKLSSKFDAWLIPRRYVCSNCGYIGPIILEIEVNKRKTRNE